MHDSIQNQLDCVKVNCEHLQAWIAEHADTSSLNPRTRELLKSTRLSVMELLSVAFLANEGLVLFKRLEDAGVEDTPFKPNTNSTKENFQYEAIFKHIAAVETFDNTDNTHNTHNTHNTDSTDNTNDSDDKKLDALISAIDLDEDIPSWLKTDPK